MTPASVIAGLGVLVIILGVAYLIGWALDAITDPAEPTGWALRIIAGALIGFMLTTVGVLAVAFLNYLGTIALNLGSNP